LYTTHINTSISINSWGISLIQSVNNTLCCISCVVIGICSFLFSSAFPTVIYNFINVFKSLHNQLSLFCSSQHNFPWHKYQKHYLQVCHPEDQPRKQLWFILHYFFIFTFKTLQVDCEFHIAWTHYVLNLEIFELHRKSNLLNYSCIFPASKVGILFWLGSGYHHLSTTEH
jgi:hypothetical protein